MIKINLSPVRAEFKTNLSITGTVITLNGEQFDLSLLGDGGSAYHEELGMVSRSGDDYECTVKLFHGRAAPQDTRFPMPLEIISDYTHKYEAGVFK